jgi:hypothetical protein
MKNFVRRFGVLLPLREEIYCLTRAAKASTTFQNGSFPLLAHNLSATPPNHPLR